MNYDPQNLQRPEEDPLRGLRAPRQRRGLQIFGFPLRIEPFFFVTAALIGGRLEPLWLVVWVVVVLVGVLAHELGHAFAGRRLGLEPWIRLIAFGGMTGWMRARPLTALQQIFISAAGPAVGITIGGAVLVAGRLGVFANAPPRGFAGAGFRGVGQSRLGGAQPAADPSARRWPHCSIVGRDGCGSQRPIRRPHLFDRTHGCNRAMGPVSRPMVDRDPRCCPDDLEHPGIARGDGERLNDSLPKFQTRAVDAPDSTHHIEEGGSRRKLIRSCQLICRPTCVQGKTGASPNGTAM